MDKAFAHPLDWMREPDWDHHRARGRFGMSYEFYAAGDGFSVRIEYPFQKKIGFANSIDEAMEIGHGYNSKPFRTHLLNSIVHQIKSFIAKRKYLGHLLRKRDVQYANIHRQHEMKRYS